MKQILETLRRVGMKSRHRLRGWPLKKEDFIFRLVERRKE